jgi:aspartate/methionine/tyrosine aminotransferase
MGRRVVDAHIGAPSHEPPLPVRQAIERLSSDSGREYKPFTGIPELREEIARYIKKWIGINADPNRVIITSGGVHGLYIVFKIFSNLHAVLPKPHFPHYSTQAKLNNVSVEYYNVCSKNIVDEVLSRLNDKTKLVMINYPNNPTGYYPSGGELKQLYEELRNRGILLANDIAYYHIYYEEKPAPVGDILIDTFSKTLSLPGLRVGYLYWGAENYDEAGRMVYWTTSGVSDVSQSIILEMLKTLDSSYFEYIRSYYKPKRDIIVKLLKEEGFTFPNPRGAFYIFPEHQKIDSSVTLAQNLIMENRKVNVGIVPGPPFMGGEKQFRISFGKLSEEDIYILINELKTEINRS